MKLSVLIIDYDRPQHLRACLRGLSFQTRHPDEIIVVDDGSSPESEASIREAVATCDLPITLIRRERDAYCPAAARNAAIRQASHEYLLFLDCDILALPDLIALHITEAAPGTFLIGNRGLLSADDSRPFLETSDWDAQTVQAAWEKADTEPLNQAARRFRIYAGLRRFGLAARHKPKLLSGHFSIAANDVHRINGFDENFKGWGYEDDEFGMRLYKAGCQSRSLIKTARALHLWHPSFAPDMTTRRQDRPNRAYFRRRSVPPFCENGLTAAL